MRRFLFALILVSTTSSWAQKVNLDDKKLETTLSPVQKADIKKKYLLKSKDDLATGIRYLRLDFAPYIMKMDRDILTYNYRKIDEVGFKPGDPEDVDTKVAVEYAKKWASAAKKHLPDETGAMGWGLYTSAGPSGSAGYGFTSGKSKFALVTVKYPKDSAMLDLRATGSLFTLSPESSKFFKSICPELDGGYFSKMHFIRNPLCHKIYVKTLESFGVKGLIYDYTSSRSDYCNQTSAGAPAFVSIDLPIEDRTIDYYTELDRPAREAAKKIQSEEDPIKREALINAFPLGKKTFLLYEKMATRIVDSTPVHQFAEAFVDFKSTDYKVLQAHKEEFKKESFYCDANQTSDQPTKNPEKVWDVMLEDGYLSLDLGKALNSALESCKE